MKSILFQLNSSFVAPAEDFSDNEDSLPKEITKWNSNDLMDKIEAVDTEEASSMMMTQRAIKDGIMRLRIEWQYCVCR